MEFYKSDKIEEKIEEAMNNIREVVVAEYSKNNERFKENKRLITKNRCKYLALKTDAEGKYTNPSKRLNELAQLSINIDRLINENENIIENDPRIYLAYEIYNYCAMEPLLEGDITKDACLLALEQLLQDLNAIKARIPDDIKFEDIRLRTDIGIDKLATRGVVDAENLRSESADISRNYYEDLKEHGYLSEIIKSVESEFPNDHSFIERLRMWDDYQLTIMRQDTEEMLDLKKAVDEMLQEHNITTGFDTVFETTRKKVKNSGKALVNKLFHRDRKEEGADSKNVSTNIETDDKHKTRNRFITESVGQVPTPLLNDGEKESGDGEIISEKEQTD